MGILEINSLYKRFGKTDVLSDVCLDIQRGAVCGLLGPNGAGKTTLLRIINHLLIPDSGTVTIDGLPASLETSRHIGYMPEERGLYENMRVEDQIMYLGLLKGATRENVRAVMDEYLELFRMSSDKKRRIGELSKGNQQKVQIIATIAHSPTLVILDEPFSGFDPINGALLQELVGRLNEKGQTVILSSHNIPAVEEMCDSIALLINGRMMLHDNISLIKENYKTGTFLLTTRQPLPEDSLIEAGVATAVSQIPSPEHRTGYTYHIEKVPGISGNDVILAAAPLSEIMLFREELPSLSDVFLEYMNGSDMH